MWHPIHDYLHRKWLWYSPDPGIELPFRLFSQIALDFPMVVTWDFWSSKCNSAVTQKFHPFWISWLHIFSSLLRFLILRTVSFVSFLTSRSYKASHVMTVGRRRPFWAGQDIFQISQMQSILLIRWGFVRLSRTLKYISLVRAIQCIARRWKSTMTMDRKGCERRRLWHEGNFLVRLRKNTKTLLRLVEFLAEIRILCPLKRNEF